MLYIGKGDTFLQKEIGVFPWSMSLIMVFGVLEGNLFRT